MKAREVTKIVESHIFEGNKRVTMSSETGGFVDLVFEKPEDLKYALQYLKKQVSPYSQSKFQFGLNGDKKVSISPLIGRLTTYDYRLVGMILKDCGFDVYDKERMM